MTGLKTHGTILLTLYSIAIHSLACGVALAIARTAPAPIASWCQAWGDVRCAKLLWDFEIPSYDIGSGGWKPGRILGFYGARWPDAYFIDLSDSVVRDPFTPADVSGSPVLARVRSVVNRQIRQPDGMLLGVTLNMVVKGGMYMGSQPTLAERPDPLLEASPPVIAWWLATRLSDSTAIGVVRSESSRFEFEILELKAVAELRREPNEGAWYLASFARIGPDSKPWWSAEFRNPKQFGSSLHVLGTERVVRVLTSERKIGNTVVPAPPTDRTDYLLEAILTASCPSSEFTQDTANLTMSSIGSPPDPRAEELNRKRMESAFSPERPSSRPQKTSSEGPSASWWLVGTFGVACLGAGSVLWARRRK